MDFKNSDAKQSPDMPGISRRGFIKSCGAGTVAMAVGGGAAGQEGRQMIPRLAEETGPVTLLVNGKQREVLVEPCWTLLFVLREKLGLTAAKSGCEREKGVSSRIVAPG